MPPYAALYEDIVEFTGLGGVLVAGDFNARTASRQASFFDTADDMFTEMENLDIERTSEDNAACTDYGEHLLALEEAHGLAIFNSQILGRPYQQEISMRVYLIKVRLCRGRNEWYL